MQEELIMDVLFIDWPCFGRANAILALEQMGYRLTMFSHKDYQERLSHDFEEEFQKALSKRDFKFCFSFNFYPLAAEGCKKRGVPYLALVYDNPHVSLYSYTVIYPTNYIFLFDSQEYQKLKRMGIRTVYYTPLPASTVHNSISAKQNPVSQKYRCDISFVGALYNEAHNLFERLADVNDYARGYLEAVIEAQLRIYGCNFLENVLNNNVMEEIMRVSPYANDKYGVETPQYIYANYFLSRKITSLERTRFLTAIGERFPDQLKLFTLNKEVQIPHVRNMGTADYYEEMPYIFANSKINLNISLKSIQAGIPLRAMDIMGAGGFLLTNYQADFLDYFIPDEDFVYYNDMEDLLTKIDFYLSHDKERKEIAENGHRKVKENHSYERCFEYMLSTSGFRK